MADPYRNQIPVVDATKGMEEKLQEMQASLAPRTSEGSNGWEKGWTCSPQTLTRDGVRSMLSAWKRTPSEAVNASYEAYVEALKRGWEPS